MLWLAIRTTGIPLGPAAGKAEPFGARDLVASTAEWQRQYSAYRRCTAAVVRSSDPPWRALASME
jgi:hypothetical protein